MAIMLRHWIYLPGIIALLGLAMVYPHLPGDFDPLTQGLSAMVQVFGFAGLPLAFIGVLWLALEFRNRARHRQQLPVTNKGFSFALAALIIGSLIAVIVSLVALMTTGIILCVLTAALSLWAFGKAISGLKRLRTTSSPGVHPAPWYLVSIPVAVVLLQLTLARPLTDFSRNRAIGQSAELIEAIELHRVEQGRYPQSMLALWPDYYPDVAGIDRFHYAVQGEGYNLAFRQPRFLFDNFGTEEFVVYNPRDEQIMPSHASWILVWSPDQLARQQGWFAVHDAAQPHWKQFWFD